MNEFLIIYATALTVAFGWWGLKSKKERGTHIPIKKQFDSKAFENILNTALSNTGIHAKVQEIPSDPIEAIMVQSHKILQAIKASEATSVVWLSALRDKLNDHKRDMEAVLKASVAMTNATKVIIDAIGKGVAEEGSVDAFLHKLEYARDKFAETPAQKKVVEGIISKVKISHVRK